MNPHIQQDALLSSEKLKSGSHQRGIFIDCGSNLGQGFKFFRQYYTPDLYDYVLVEPNPFCVEVLTAACKELDGNMRIIAEAAGASVGETKFFGLHEANNVLSVGGSTLKLHNSKCYTVQESKAIDVKLFRFATLISEERPKYGSIVVKMDIEGAEYDVLDDLINSNTHKLIDVLYVEFHSKYMTEPDGSLYRQKEAQLLEKLVADGVHVRLWM